MIFLFWSSIPHVCVLLVTIRSRICVVCCKSGMLVESFNSVSGCRLNHANTSVLFRSAFISLLPTVSVNKFCSFARPLRIRQDRFWFRSWDFALRLRLSVIFHSSSSYVIAWSVRAGRSGDRILVGGGRFFAPVPEWPWSSASLLYSGYRVLSRGQSCLGVALSTQSSNAGVKERV